MTGLECTSTPTPAGEGTAPAGPGDPAETTRRWAATAHLVSTLYDPRLEAVRYARTFVHAQLEAIGLGECADDAGLMVSELAANAVLHARTPFTIHLRPTLEGGARVEVHDHSPLPPVHTAPSASAMSGRGLDLVASMATRWGSFSLPDDVDPTSGAAVPSGQDGADALDAPLGKIVWFEVEAGAAAPVVEASVEELLALWSDQEEDLDLARDDRHHVDRVDRVDASGAARPAVRHTQQPRTEVSTDMSTDVSTDVGTAVGTDHKDEHGADRQPRHDRRGRGRTPGGAAGLRPHSTAGIITSSIAVVGTTHEVLVRELGVAELVAAKEAMDDLLREAQLLLLATPARGMGLHPSEASGPGGSSASGAWGASVGTGDRTNRLNGELVVAARLDAAARAFEGARRQIREQATRAAARGQQRLRVRLHLPASARAAAIRYRDAVAAAGKLRAHGQLLALAGDTDIGAGVRDRFLADIIDQLPADLT